MHPRGCQQTGRTPLCGCGRLDLRRPRAHTRRHLQTRPLRTAVPDAPGPIEPREPIPREPMSQSELRYVVEVAAAGSLRRAAETLHIAPSALSRQIANLEHELGVPLFDRHAGGMKPTAFGEAVIRHARATLRGYERMRSEIDDLQSLRRGHVKINAAEGAVADFVFDLVSQLRGEYPGITYEVVVAGSRSSLDALAQDQCDIGIIFQPEPHPDVAVLKEITHPIRLIAAPGHPFSRREVVALHELEAGPLCLQSPEFTVRMVFDQAIKAAHIEVKPAVVINSVEFSKTFARDGLGVSLVPLFAVRRDVLAGTLCAVRVDCAAFERSSVAICVHKERLISLAAETVVQRMLTAFDTFAAPR